MKIILSRKGFDSSNGGCASPIFPDGRLVSLPIPASNAPADFSDVGFDGLNIGQVVADLSKARARGSGLALAHTRLHSRSIGARST